MICMIRLNMSVNASYWMNSNHLDILKGYGNKFVQSSGSSQAEMGKEIYL